MIYMAGDNNLSQAGFEDIDELCQIGSSDDTTFLVEFDSEGYYRETIRYEISQPEADAKAHAIIRQKLGETDSGNPKTLARFLEWGAQHYPAENYFLIIWNHGGGFKYRRILEKLQVDPESQKYLLSNPRHNQPANRLYGLARHTVFFHPEMLAEPLSLDTPMPHVRNIAWDDMTGNSLDLLEIRKTLLKVRKKQPNFNLAIIGFDACLMNMLEVAYQLRDLCGAVFGSEETEPFAGWPYHKLAAFFAGNKGDFSLPELAKSHVKAYRDYYKLYPDEPITQSVIAAAGLKDLASVFDQWATLFSRLLSENLEVCLLIRHGVQTFTFGDYVDIGDLVKLTLEHLREKMPDHPLSVAMIPVTDQFFKFYEKTVLADVHRHRTVAHSTGLSLWFPNKRSLFTKSRKHYAKLEFSRDFPAWLNFLEALFKRLER